VNSGQLPAGGQFFGRRGRSGSALITENRRLITGSRLDTQQSARFLSNAGIVLESWRGTHWLDGAAQDARVAGLGFQPKAVSNRKQTAVGSRTGRRAESWNRVLGEPVTGLSITSLGSMSGRSLSRTYLTAGVKPSPFPETNFVQAPAQSRVCLCPERSRRFAAGGV
jgi:hypothetical protein